MPRQSDAHFSYANLEGEEGVTVQADFASTDAVHPLRSAAADDENPGQVSLLGSGPNEEESREAAALHDKPHYSAMFTVAVFAGYAALVTRLSVAMGSSEDTWMQTRRTGTLSSSTQRLSTT